MLNGVLVIKAQMKTLLILPIAVLLSLSSIADPGDIKVKVKNIRSSKGNILISIYNKASQFPLKPFKTVRLKKSKLKNGELYYTIKGLKEGEYAISLLDDENMNEDMDYTWLGIPKEGYSFSNKARPSGISAPTFNDASFKLGKENKSVILDIEYW